MLVIERLGKLAVIDLVILPADALLGHAGGAAGLEDAKRPTIVGLGTPNLVWHVAQPLVLKVRKLRDDVIEACDLLSRVPAGFLCPVQPEWRTGLG